MVEPQPQAVLAFHLFFSARLLCFEIEAHVCTLPDQGKFHWR